MATVSAETAVIAAGAAVWSWRTASDRLVVHADPGSGFAQLDGDWRLEAFLNLLEGLGRPMLAAQLRRVEPGNIVDARTRLEDGSPVHMVGSFHDLGVARGLIVAGAGEVRPVRAGGLDVVAVFQPIRRLSDLSVAGFEALARFSTPGGGLVGPEGLANGGEEADWFALAPAMLAQSAELLASLRRTGHDVFMQVNLSAAELSRPLLVEEIAEIIRSAGLPSGALRIELTEQAAIRDLEGALGALSAFQAAGAGIVLDDFGAGHSSFAWLAEVPAQGVKLDPRLVRMSDRPRALAILSGLTRLLHDLGLKVTAEGVEDEARGGDLLRMGCDYVQGFAYDLPMTAADAARLLRPPEEGG